MNGSVASNGDAFLILWRVRNDHLSPISSEGRPNEPSGMEKSYEPAAKRAYYQAAYPGDQLWPYSKDTRGICEYCQIILPEAERSKADSSIDTRKEASSESK